MKLAKVTAVSLLLESSERGARDRGRPFRQTVGGQSGQVSATQCSCKSPCVCIVSCCSQEAGLLDAKLKDTDVDFVFLKSKSKDKRRISFEQFMTAMDMIAEKKVRRMEDGG